MAYLGGVTFSDMPTGLGNAEIELYVYPNNVYYCIMRSSNLWPYVWECNSHTYRGWEPANHDKASIISYNNINSGLTATTTQQAIDEIVEIIGDVNTLLDTINGEVI